MGGRRFGVLRRLTSNVLARMQGRALLDGHERAEESSPSASPSA
jgi:hypothetical protein